MSLGQSFRRSRLSLKTASAFAPAAITNFFSISYLPQNSHRASPVGATGGGYVLSRGVLSRAEVRRGGSTGSLAIVVNGDPHYDARTTRRAVSILVERWKLAFEELKLDQSVDVPIGAGFGASAASALSAVFAVAAAIGIDAPPSELAMCAHEAEIIEQTGLGTVSVTFQATGAGAITRPGVPGVAQFLNVRVPPSTRLVTATIGAYEKRKAFSSPATTARICESGERSLSSLLANPTLEELAAQGETFSTEVGLGSDGVHELARIARGAGASHASQNMIGLSVHAIADDRTAGAVAAALAGSRLAPRVDVFEVGSVRAGPI